MRTGGRGSATEGGRERRTAALERAVSARLGRSAGEPKRQAPWHGRVSHYVAPVHLADGKHSGRRDILVIGIALRTPGL
ncbi:hypothetical protein ACQSMD_02280 [Streptomyces flavovirens]|uniref:hypothetical protein n=1 Tax=Streptomyces TaxID=1883 RepID=UPI000DAD6AE9|nr:hypothetical protein [Streptomyces sp. SID8358]MYU35553.1 hypothetical protein [Streptomyces sp. SID8358]